MTDGERSISPSLPTSPSGLGTPEESPEKLLLVLRAINGSLDCIIMVMKGRPGWARFEEDMEKIRGTKYFSDIRMPLEKVKQIRQIYTSPEIKKDPGKEEKTFQKVSASLAELAHALNLLSDRIESEA